MSSSSSSDGLDMDRLDMAGAAAAGILDVGVGDESDDSFAVDNTAGGGGFGGGSGVVVGNARQLSRQLQHEKLIRENIRKENEALLKKISVLESREQTIATMAMEGRERWSEQQRQIANLKLTLHQQLQSPISDEEFTELEVKNEEERDLVDTIKLAVYKQIGVLKKSRDSAVTKAGELSAMIASLESKLNGAEDRLREAKEGHKLERDRLHGQLDESELKMSQLSALQSKYNDVEHRLKTTQNDREQFFNTKMELGAKTNECLRLEVQLKEFEEKYLSSKSEAECLNQKLDILKSEYYESKLHYKQRIMELESSLQASEEKVKTLKDLEIEAEIFMSNIATSTSASGGAVGVIEGGGESVNSDGQKLLLPFDVPVSRRLQHSVSVTKRALTLENQLISSKHELKVSQEQNEKLRQSLTMAKAALSNSGSPYALVEEALETKDNEIQVLKSRLVALESENTLLQDRCRNLSSDVSILHRQRQELAAMREAIRQLGVPAVTASSPGRGDSANHRLGSSPQATKKVSSAGAAAQRPPQQSTAATVHTAAPMPSAAPPAHTGLNEDVPSFDSVGTADGGIVFQC